MNTRRYSISAGRHCAAATVQAMMPAFTSITGVSWMRRIACFAFALVWLAVAPAGARDNYPRSTAVDALHYRIQLELKESGDQISGATEILFAFNEENVKAIALDFSDLTVDEASENDRATTYAQAGERLTVQLAGRYHRGEQCRVRVTYHGAPKDGLFIKANKFGDRTILTD